MKPPHPARPWLRAARESLARAAKAINNEQQRSELITIQQLLDGLIMELDWPDEQFPPRGMIG